MRSAALALMIGSALWAQQDNKPASISGVVKDAGTSEPVAGASVEVTTGIRMVNNTMVQSKDSKRLSITADAQGHYSFADLPAGEGTLSVALRPRELPSARVTFNLKAGQQVSYDIPVYLRGTISGKVLDENGEPVPAVTVFLVGREYHAGAIRTLVKQIVRANDQGEYTLEWVDAGRPYLVFADSRKNKLEAISPMPEDPKMRRQVLAPAFYPNSRDIAGAAPLVLRSGEKREGIDIKMTKAPGFCVEATLEKAGVHSRLRFDIGVQQPSFGTGANSGLYSSNPGGTTEADGQVRVCDLTPGVYTLQAMEAGRGMNTVGAPAMGTTTIVISDRDVKGVKVEALVAQPVAGEVVLDGKAPADPISGTVSISLNPLVRAHFQGEQMDAKPSVPGAFTLASVPEGEYSFFAPSPPEGYYIKDITYAGVSVLRGTLRVGSAMGAAGLRVIIAPGAGKINSVVTDQRGKPAVAVNVVAIPAGVASEAALAAGLVKSSTDQDGECTLYRMAPGKYQVMAVMDQADMTPEFITRLLQARATRAQEVEVTDGAVVRVELKVSSLR